MIGSAVAVTNTAARRLSVPPVLIFLIIGALLGPSVAHVVEPEEIGELFPVVIEVLVAIIVFEGAFSIDVSFLRRVGSVVRNLLTLGVLITFAAGSLLAYGLDVLPLRTALLFGALVTVTGPTVISPLVKRIKLNQRVESVLVGEGVLVDPIGATLAIVALEVALSGFDSTPVLFVPTRLLGGALIGFVAAFAARGILRLVDEMSTAESTLLLLGLGTSAFSLAEILLHDSGLAAVAVMGVVLSGARVPHADEVRTFADDLSKFLIGGVYILAVATVDLELITELWPSGFTVVAVLMFAVRPIAVHLSALGSDLTMRERSFVGLVGPRGVVAAALAAFSAEALGPDGSGPTLAALVFATVFITVAVQSSYAGWLTGVLNVGKMRAMIAGSGPMARRVGQQLTDRGYDVVLVDDDPQSVAAARSEGREVVEASASDVDALDRAGAGETALAVGTSEDDQVNLLFCQYIQTAQPDAEVYARVSQDGAGEAFESAGIPIVRSEEALSLAMLDLMGTPLLARTLGAGDRTTVDLWIGSGLAGRRVRDLGLPESVLLLLVQRPGGDLIPRGDTELERGDRIVLFGGVETVREARARLAATQ